MRTQISNLIQAGLVLATVAAGATMMPPAAVAQTQTTTHKKSLSSSSTKSGSGSTTHSHTGTAAHTSSSSAKSGNKSSTAKTTSSRFGKSPGKRSSKTRKVKGQAAPTPERINEIQDALAKRGMFTGEPSGKWDDSTVDAMKKFQTTNHLNPTGKLDAPTLQKLGFGSETAGVAAPTPPPNSTSNRLLSKNTPKDPEPSDEN